MYAIYDPETTQLLRLVSSGRRLTAADGTTFEDASLMPTDDLKAAGVHPVRDDGPPDLTGKRLLFTTVPQFLDNPQDELALVYMTEDLTSEEAAAQLDQARKEAILQIDTAAERAREQFMTPGAGQALTYQRKLEEARAYANDAPGPFPLLEASVGSDGADVAAVAATVLATADAWSVVAAQIEGQRLRAKRAVAAAETHAAIVAELAALTWPSP